MATIGARKPTALLVAALASGIPVEAPSAEAQALYTQMEVPPSQGRRVLIDRQTLRPLQASGVWWSLDAFWTQASHDSQAGRLNWKRPGTWTLTATNSPVFTADRGYAGDGAAAYLTASGYNPSTAGGNYSLNSATIGIFIQQANTLNAAFDLFGTNGPARFQVSATTTTHGTRLNDGSTTLSVANSNMAGNHLSARRLSSAGKDFWSNGVQIAAVDASPSTSMPTALGLLANINGPNNYSNGRQAAAYTAGGLDDPGMVAMENIIRRYMQSVGAA